jgi:two-component system chemotaxis response regulator CheY
MANKILIVDDDTITRKFISFILRSSGFEVVTARDGIEALEMLALFDVDLMITDLNMPKMDGVELISCVRKSTGNDNLPIIMLTTEGDAETRKTAMEAGATEYMVKPVSGEQLSSKIWACIGAEQVS